MISDDVLEFLLNPPPGAGEVVVTSIIVEALQELKERRQADRAIWENAPEWANWYAIDDDGSKTYYEYKPEPVIAGWWYSEKGRTESFLVRDWQSTLQERPK